MLPLLFTDHIFTPSESVPTALSIARGQMNTVLSVTFPQPVPLFLDFVSFISLDARKLIRLECGQRIF